MPGKSKSELRDIELQIIEWLRTPSPERVKKQQLIDNLGVNRLTFNRVKKQELAGGYDFYVDLQSKKREAKQLIASESVRAKVKVPKDKDIMKQAVIDRLFRKVMESGDSNAAHRLAQILKWVDEKGTDVKVNVDASIIRQYLAGATDSGIPEVLTGQRLLPTKIREDKGQS